MVTRFAYYVHTFMHYCDSTDNNDDLGNEHMSWERYFEPVIGFAMRWMTTMILVMKLYATADIMFYTGHRAMHAVSWLKGHHAAHHKVRVTSSVHSFLSLSLSLSLFLSLSLSLSLSLR